MLNFNYSSEPRKVLLESKWNWSTGKPQYPKWTTLQMTVFEDKQIQDWHLYTLQWGMFEVHRGNMWLSAAFVSFRISFWQKIKIKKMYIISSFLAGTRKYFFGPVGSPAEASLGLIMPNTIVAWFTSIICSRSFQSLGCQLEFSPGHWCTWHPLCLAHSARHNLPTEQTLTIQGIVFVN